MSLCPFCHPEKFGATAANVHALALFDAFPVTPGHTLITPKRHISSLFEATREEQTALLEVLKSSRLRRHEFFLLIVPNLGIIVPNMGTIKAEHAGLGEALFSKTQRQVLGLLFGNPDRSYYAKEIVRLAGVGIGTVQRELEKLSGAGLLSVKRVGNQKHYQADRHSPIFEELRGIVLKTFGVGDLLRLAMAELTDQIKVAFVYGSVAKGTDKAHSDIDVMIISEELSYDRVFSALSAVESKLGRTVNPTLYKPSEFRDKLIGDNSFLIRVIEQPKIFLIGTENDIPES